MRDSVLSAAIALGIAAYLLLPIDPSERLDRLLEHDRDALPVRDPLREWFVRIRGRLLPSREQARDRLRCLRALDALAAELAAGMPPSAALVHLDDPVLAHSCAAARMHGSIPVAMRRDAETIPALAALAGAWQAAERYGAPLAPVVTTVAADLRAATAVQRELDAELASALASFRVLSALPIAGLVFGTVMGASPLSWLTGTPVGRVALVAGILLMLLGAAWMRLIVRGISA